MSGHDLRYPLPYPLPGFFPTTLPEPYPKSKIPTRPSLVGGVGAQISNVRGCQETLSSIQEAGTLWQSGPWVPGSLEAYRRLTLCDQDQLSTAQYCYIKDICASKVLVWRWKIWSILPAAKSKLFQNAPNKSRQWLVFFSHCCCRGVAVNPE